MKETSPKIPPSAEIWLWEEKKNLKKGLKFNVKRGLENIKESEEVVFEVWKVIGKTQLL